MALLKQSTNRSRVVMMIDSSDHVTGKASLTLTITASKDGAAFASISPTVTDLGSGWYKLALTTSHTDTLGDLALHITSTGADPTDIADQVVLDLPGATGIKVDVDTIKTNPVVNGGTLTFPSGATLASTTNITAGTVTTATNVTTVNGLAAGVITAASIAADAITDAKVASDVTIASVTGAVGSVTGAVGSVTAVVSANVTKVNGTTVNGDGSPGNEWGP